MRWLKNKLRNWLNDTETENGLSSPKLIRAADREADIEGIRFTVMAATGGYILQSRNYDRKTDRTSYQTYLIHDNEDIAEEVGRLVALELYRS
jgi:hypothetical protein